MPKLHPIDTLVKITIAVIWWLIVDAFGNGVILLLTETIKNYPSEPPFVGLNLVRPVGLVLVNIYVIYQCAKDVVEFIENVKSFGFRWF